MITLEPIAYVRNTRQTLVDDYWGATVSAIELVEQFDASSLFGLETFSHAEIIYYFHQVD
jgi:tRNA (Thr-GGU) A37 N-methylase